MKAIKKYKIAVFALACLAILEAIFLIILLIKYPKEKIKPKIPAKPPKIALKGKIAIVLDDWGYNLNNFHVLERIRYPLTMSVLPNLNYSQAAAEKLHDLGFEVILHFPLEPHEKLNLEKNTVTTSMSEAQIKEILNRDIDSVPYVVGISNHMGSKATEDKRIMKIIFSELKDRRLFFLDSLVSGKSICTKLAKEMNLKFAKRDIFLDNQENPEYIKKQINKLKIKAQKYGSAIGIGHDRPVTLSVLQEVMPQLEKEGFKFVFVSDILKN